MDKRLKSLPKIELHRHLEGSIPMPLVLAWSEKYNLPLPKEKTAESIQARSPMPFSDVLDKILYQQRCYQNIESVETLTYEVIKSIAEDNIKMIELRFSPGFIAEPKNLPFNSIMEAALSAKERAQRDFDIEVGYLLISSRDFGLETCSETIDLALKWKNEIVGVDLAGNELDFPDHLFEKPFLKAHHAGLKITTHSGEVTHAKNVLISIEKLKSTRIGHGVQSIKDQNVIDYLVKHKIPLELCPTSNYITQAVDSLETHPLKQLMEAGVLVTINSDDPTLFGTTLSQEYEIAMNQIGLTFKQIQQTILNSFHASFLPKQQKDRAWKKHFKSLENLC
jgi:adenosine deaminase